MNNIEILEELANNEHIRWTNWQKYVHSICIENEDGTLTIPKEYVEHWNYEINTEYKELPENIKESDRKEVRKILEILNYENLIKENKELKEENNKLKTCDGILDVFSLGKESSRQRIEFDYIPKSKVKELLEEIKKEKNVAITKMLNEDYHLAENGAVCQTLDYIEGRIEKLLED